MNAEIVVGSMNVSLSAILVEPTPISCKIFIVDTKSFQPLTHSRSTIISLNGHSLSAINPDVLIGGEATLIAA